MAVAVERLGYLPGPTSRTAPMPRRTANRSWTVTSRRQSTRVVGFGTAEASELGRQLALNEVVTGHELQELHRIQPLSPFTRQEIILKMMWHCCIAQK
jgi:hypothetical protein